MHFDFTKFWSDMVRHGDSINGDKAPRDTISVVGSVRREHRRFPQPPLAQGCRSDMQAFRIQGGTPLSGRLTVDGSKNAALPLMAASLLSPKPILLHGVPPLADVNNRRRRVKAPLLY